MLFCTLLLTHKKNCVITKAENRKRLGEEWLSKILSAHRVVHLAMVSFSSLYTSFHPNTDLPSTQPGQTIKGLLLSLDLIIIL